VRRELVAYLPGEDAGSGYHIVDLISTGWNARMPEHLTLLTYSHDGVSARGKQGQDDQCYFSYHGIVDRNY
jgi:hypothetical protein